MTRAIGLFALLTIAMTWPQTRVIATDATPHQDIYFNMWRLEWFAHAVATHPSRLFDANVFYPEPDTLALSDAMIVEGVVAAPLVLSGMRPVLAHNLLLLGAIALSGAAMFALARYLTGSRAAGVIAGTVFAFAPYRADHIMHMELQWTMWMPLAFLALHRLFDTGRMRYGLATGACLALQMLSSIYYGLFLGALLGLGAALFLIARDQTAPFRKTIAPLAAAATIVVAVSVVYARPYNRTHALTGDRPIHEIYEFSARPASYLAATPNNWLYGGTPGRTGAPERRLFPGTIALLLAITGLLLVVPSRRAIVYLLLLSVAFELSLGLDGYSYRVLYEYVPAFRGLRAMARVGVFVLMFVAVLAAYGYRLLVATQSPAARRAVLAVVTLMLLMEYRVTLTFVPYPNTAPEVYQILRDQPRGVVLEMPAPRPNALPGDDARYSYMSTFYWFPLVNGYSGFYPPSYIGRLERLRDFPDETSVRQMKADDVKYVIVHASGYSEPELSQIGTRLREIGMAELGTYSDGAAPATIFQAR